MTRIHILSRHTEQDDITLSQQSKPLQASTCKFSEPNEKRRIEYLGVNPVQIFTDEIKP